VDREADLRSSLLVAIGVALAGCATLRLPDPQGMGTARVSGDPAISAGLPVQALLRQVDGRHVDMRYSSIEVPAGHHALLVDCRVAETGATSRHALDVELESGVSYRLVAVATAQRCEAVELQSR
jgi:hypothetical protein